MRNTSKLLILIVVALVATYFLNSPALKEEVNKSVNNTVSLELGKSKPNKVLDKQLEKTNIINSSTKLNSPIGIDSSDDRSELM